MAVKDGFITTVFSTRLWKLMQIIDENICLIQYVVNRKNKLAVSVNNGAFFQFCSVLICSYEYAQDS